MYEWTEADAADWAEESLAIAEQTFAAVAEDYRRQEWF